MPEGSDLGGDRESWDGRSYYGRRQLKPAPFNRGLVGSYVFLAGLSGGAQLLASAMDLARGRAAADVGTAWPVSFAAGAGTWQRVPDPRPAHAAAILQHVADVQADFADVARVVDPGDVRRPQRSHRRRAIHSRPGAGFRLAALAGTGGALPAAVAGTGMGTYTASLLSATSTPLWAAAPKRLAVRFGASSVASAAAALGLGERCTRVGRDLESVAVAALAVELASTLASADSYRRLDSDAMAGETLGAALPLGMLLGSLVLTRGRFRLLSTSIS